MFILICKKMYMCLQFLQIAIPGAIAVTPLLPGLLRKIRMYPMLFVVEC